MTEASKSADACRQVAEWLDAAANAAVLTGAGASTESGVPDFRSPGGVWSKYRTVYFDEFMASHEARHEYWRQKVEMHAEMADAAPNAGHLVLAKWQDQGRLRGVITQNIDGLHQLAGSKQVLELHGTAREAACLDCRWRGPIEPFIESFQREQATPDCPECGGRLKHATISFGQSLPVQVLNEAAAWAQEADLFFAIGSSLVVSPAADLPRVAAASGARLVIINRDPTPLDPVADIVLHDSIGEVLTQIDEYLPD
ncbi:MAG: NAD-dependent deacylase [Planctomycetota bacterium]